MDASETACLRLPRPAAARPSTSTWPTPRPGWRRPQERLDRVSPGRHVRPSGRGHDLPAERASRRGPPPTPAAPVPRPAPRRWAAIWRGAAAVQPVAGSPPRACAGAPTVGEQRTFHVLRSADVSGHRSRRLRGRRRARRATWAPRWRSSSTTPRRRRTATLSTTSPPSAACSTIIFIRSTSRPSAPRPTSTAMASCWCCCPIG